MEQYCQLDRLARQTCNLKLKTWPVRIFEDQSVCMKTQPPTPSPDKVQYVYFGGYSDR